MFRAPALANALANRTLFSPYGTIWNHMEPAAVASGLLGPSRGEEEEEEGNLHVVATSPPIG